VSVNFKQEFSIRQEKPSTQLRCFSNLLLLLLLASTIFSISRSPSEKALLALSRVRRYAVFQTNCYYSCMADDSGAARMEEISTQPAATCWKCRGFSSTLCKVCSGLGYIRRTRRRESKLQRTIALYPDFKAPGPVPPSHVGSVDMACGLGEELCFLAGNWKLFQKKADHRYSTDDVVTAWAAYRMRSAVLRASTEPLRTLDIGCGIGSVLLMTAWLFPDASCLGVEAQPRRAAQAERSIRYNGVASRVAVRIGDLRDRSVAAAGAFDIVTGT
jgi:hypothetical protein